MEKQEDTRLTINDIMKICDENEEDRKTRNLWKIAIGVGLVSLVGFLAHTLADIVKEKEAAWVLKDLYVCGVSGTLLGISLHHSEKIKKRINNRNKILTKERKLINEENSIVKG